MKTALKIVAIIILTPLAIGATAAKDYIWAFLLWSSVVFFIYKIIPKQIINTDSKGLDFRSDLTKSAGRDSIKKTAPVIEKSAPVAPRQNLQLAMQVSGQMYQALETTYILLNSTNLETVKNRFDFFYEILLPTILESSKMDSFLAVRQIAIDKYNADYYDRNVTQEQLDMIDNAEFIYNNWQQFQDQCLVACYQRYAKHQMMRLSELKTVKGRQNRKELIVENGWKLYHSFQRQEAKQAIRPFLDELKNLEV